MIYSPRAASLHTSWNRREQCDETRFPRTWFSVENDCHGEVICNFFKRSVSPDVIEDCGAYSKDSVPSDEKLKRRRV